MNDQEINALGARIVAASVLLSQPAPQGVAEVMALVTEYAAEVHACWNSIDDSPAAIYRECIVEAITTLVQERDALKARVAELEGDVARDAVRYRWLTYADWIDEAIMETHGIKSGLSETLDAAIDAAIAASKGAA